MISSCWIKYILRKSYRETGFSESGSQTKLNNFSQLCFWIRSLFIDESPFVYQCHKYSFVSGLWKEYNTFEDFTSQYDSWSDAMTPACGAYLCQNLSRLSFSVYTTKNNHFQWLLSKQKKRNIWGRIYWDFLHTVYIIENPCWLLSLWMVSNYCKFKRLFPTWNALNIAFSCLIWKTVQSISVIRKLGYIILGKPVA